MEKMCDIRVAEMADAALLAQLGTATFADKFGHLYAAEDLQMFLADNHTEAYYESLLKDPDFRVWLAQDPQGRSAGYAVAGLCNLPVEDKPSRSGEVKRLYIADEFQSAGLGKQFMAHMLAWLESEHFAPVYLSVYAENHGAQRFYARHGFEKIMEYEFPVGNHMDPEFIMCRPS